MMHAFKFQPPLLALEFLLLSLLTVPVQAQFSITWQTTAGGGTTTAASPSFEVGMTAGQPTTSFSEGVDSELTSGFWSIVLIPDAACDSPESIFCDDFETGDLSSWDAIGEANSRAIPKDTERSVLSKPSKSMLTRDQFQKGEENHEETR